jgi:hypothetical protein
MPAPAGPDPFTAMELGPIAAGSSLVQLKRRFRMKSADLLSKWIRVQFSGFVGQFSF